MASQVMDIKLDKSMSRGQSNEHLRNFSKEAYEDKRAHNFDPTREHHPQRKERQPAGRYQGQRAAD